MSLILRWLLRGVVGLLVLIALGGAVAWYLVSRSLPDYAGEIAVRGLSAPVTVIRDANAVPHIRAETESDAHFALGLVHAQDRLWQMEVARRSVQGRLSALFGRRTVPLDRLAKTLDLYGHAARSLPRQTAAARKALDAYAAGVNAWVRHVNARALGRGAPEFFLFDDGFAPWTPADSLAILKGMALRLTAAASHETRRGRFELDLPQHRVRDILPDYPGAAVRAPARFSSLFPGARFAVAEARARDPLADLFGPARHPEMAGASNAWAIDGSRAAGGRPILAADPHLWLSAPSLWYLADVAGGELSAIGGTLPGTPLVLIGHNGALAWGLTTAQIDDQDVYIERVDPKDPTRYRTPEGWAAFSERPIRIERAGEPALSEIVRMTRHGPVIPDNQFGVDLVTPEGHVAALAWTALTDDDATFSAALALMRAGSVADGLIATEGTVAPAQNVVLADRTRVAMALAGRIPQRDPESEAQGRIPAPGWIARHDWLGTAPAASHHRLVDPEEGAVANANNRLTDAPYPDHLSFDWDYPYRIQRLGKELAARAFHSRDGFVALQADTVSEMARAVLPLIARDLWWRQDGGGGDPRRAHALEMLANWTGEMNQHTPEPLIFAEWMRQLTRRLAADELGALFEEIAGPRPLFVERVYRDVDGASAWCDVDKTPERETCAQMAAKALDDALARLAADHGRNPEGWRWGAEHMAVHRHMPLGFFGTVGLFLNIEQETSGGDFTLMRGQTVGRGPRPFANVHAAGLRIVVDMADPNRSVMMVATGQSGHPFSRWYDDFAEGWARGEVIPMSMDDAEARAGSVGIMRLRSAGGAGR